MESITQDRLDILSALIDGARETVVVTHLRPDGDAIGSTTALNAYLSLNLGKKCRTVLSSAFSDTLTFLHTEAVEPIRLDLSPTEAEKAIAQADLIFCLDFGGLDRSGGLEDWLRASEAHKVLIDHHLHPHLEEFSLVFSDTEVSSTCELLYDILLRMPDIGRNASKLPMESITALMTGMTTDTNNFANSVFPGTLKMASELLAAGVNRDTILDHIYDSYRENRLRMMGYLLSEKLVIRKNGLAYMIFTADEQRRFDFQEGETEGFVNLPLAIASVRMSILLTQDDGYFRVSIRSKKGTSARDCAAAHFNGGGHEQASGGKLFWPKDIPTPEDAAEYIEINTAAFL